MEQNSEEMDGAVEGVEALKISQGNHGSKADDGRWAEKLLNPCAAAIAAQNLSRVQNLVYVLQELGSHKGNANQRLAGHGLRALTHHLCSPDSASSQGLEVEPSFFHKSLRRFYEVSPWFSFSINLANSCILQILNEEWERTRNLHIVDVVGVVSHGVQWPPLLEALARRSGGGGPPPLVRITSVIISNGGQNSEFSFSGGGGGGDFPPDHEVIGFAKSMNINLQINRLHNLNAQLINSSPDDDDDEMLIVCAQFSLHHLNHINPNDERSEFLKLLRNMEPKGVILSDNDAECSCNNCGDFATGFSRRVDYLWKFLDSTSSAFGGEESQERNLMEVEAAKALISRREMNQGKENWCRRMREAGFVGRVFGKDAIDGAAAFLRKFDSKWEMRVEEEKDDESVMGLWWKGQLVSFSSLWKLDPNVSGSYNT